MPTPADGVYNIHNVQFNSSVVDLVNGRPNAAIATWEPGTSTNLRWIVKNLGNDRFTLENDTARGNYASTALYSNNAGLSGTQNPTYWTSRRVAENVYTIEADNLQWEIDQSGKRVAVYLVPLAQSPATKQQWKFVRV